MSEIAPLQSALGGIRENLHRFDEAARRISRQAPFGDLPGDLVDLTVAQRGIEANVKMIRATDELVGSLLDVLG